MKFYETGIFDQFDIKNAFALHVTDEYPLGTIASTSGVLFASALEVDIEFIGESAHVAFPGEGKNAFIALRKFLDACDKLLSEISEPILFGIGKINSGTKKLKNELEQIKNKTGVDYKITKGAHYPEVIVNDELYKKYSKLLSNKFIFKDCGHKMTGEDFGFFSQKWESFMFWLGSSKGEKYGLHNPKFLPSDESIETGKNVFMEIVNNISS